MSDLFKTIASMQQAQTRVVETLGVPYADPFNEEGVISDVNDPLKLGRVKVITDDGITSGNWVPVSGSNSGTLSARYIGSRVLIGKTNGRSENMYVIGVIRNKPDIDMTGNPIQLPVVDESMAVWEGSADAGMMCNRGNEGRVYVLSNEMNQDVVVCLRRTSNQVDSNSAWSWKSLTNGLWVEKGFNPGNESTPAIAQSQKQNPGIPQCTEALLGEVHEFTEDRGFRTTTMVCRRDENKDFSWMPISSPPVFFRTTLPTCAEKLHGMEAVVDNGNNSELIVCQRYQGKMLWVKQGRRLPHKFYSKEQPLSRVQFTSNFKNISALDETPVSSTNYDWVGTEDISTVAFDTLFNSIDITGTDPKLKELLEIASMVPATAFDGAQVMRKVATESLLKKTGIPVETLTQQVRADLESVGGLTPSTAQILSGIGSAADVLVNGVSDDDTGGALQKIGTDTLRNALILLEPKTASVMTGLMSGGVMGAVDSAVAIGLDQLPDEVNRYAAPVIDIAKNLLLSDYPASLDNILNTAAGGGLLGAITSTINSSSKNNIVTPQLLEKLTTSLQDGVLGEIPKLFGSLSNLDSIFKMPAEIGSLPVLASTVLGVVGQIGVAQKLLGGGGLGIEGLDNLLGDGFSSAAVIAGGVSGLASVFGGGVSGLGCPCDPKCRKISHGLDSDGNNLLEKCGSMFANGADASNATNVPIPNNIGPIAEDIGLTSTGLGDPLIVSNRRNLSQSISDVERIGSMADRFFDSRFTDQVEAVAEMTYTFEAVEKALKATDNNITRIESVEKKLIDSLYNLLGSIVYGKKSGRLETAVIPRLIKDVRENSQAIKDLYRFTRRLDSVKDGGRAGVNVTRSLAASFQNIPDLSTLLSVNRREALKALRNGVIPAHREWKTMDPGNSGYRPGGIGEYDKTIPDPYPDERTLFDGDRVLSISAESKLGDNSPPVERTLTDLALSSNQIDTLRGLPSRDGTTLDPDLIQAGSDLLNGINNQLDLLSNIPEPDDSVEGSLYDSISDRKGQKNCQ